jgi:hypothetical protein
VVEHVTMIAQKNDHPTSIPRFTQERTKNRDLVQRPAESPLFRAIQGLVHDVEHDSHHLAIRVTNLQAHRLRQVPAAGANLILVEKHGRE